MFNAGDDLSMSAGQVQNWPDIYQICTCNLFCLSKSITVQFLPCDATWSRSGVCGLSVHLASAVTAISFSQFTASSLVMLRYCDHMGWNSSKNNVTAYTTGNISEMAEDRAKVAINSLYKVMY